MNWNYCIGLSLLLLLGCTKSEEDTPSQLPISSIPEIEILGTSTQSISEFESVTFYIGYTDGDGDLGNEDADYHALEILDSRDSILHTYHVPPQSPIPNIAINGVLEVEVKNIIIIDQTQNTEQIVFKIRLQDRAENWSNTVDSSPITITK